MGKIKLSELRAARAAMTPGEWRPSENPKRWVDLDVPQHEVASNRDNDARGVSATHNAADALIEIVEALLARRAAVRARFEANKAKWTGEWQDQEARYRKILANEERSGERLELALAAVEA